jgi:transcription elongation factor GreA
MTGSDLGAPDLIRSVGLMADGPVRWGRPVPARGPGIYLVELGAPVATAPIDLARVGKWLERLPALRMDGERPTSRALAARLASLWLPAARVLFAGATAGSIGGRVAALLAHVPGDRTPHADGQWLHVLRSLGEARIWWASTDAPDEYLDGVLDAFAAVPGGRLPDRPVAALTLPWATTRRPTGERQAHGITGSVLPADARSPEPARRVVELPDGDALGVDREVRGTGTTRRAPKMTTGARPARPGAASPPGRATRGRAAASTAPRPEPVHLSGAAVERLRAELDELTRIERPQVVARIKAARELGDLRENAEYHAAREEQSFLEGRVQALEDRLRRAVVVDEAATGRVLLGSVVTVDHDGETTTWTVVGSAEANLAAGRISAVSPVGAALLGAAAGDEVDVRTPRGAVRYRVVSVN